MSLLAFAAALTLAASTPPEAPKAFSATVLCNAPPSVAFPDVFTDQTSQCMGPARERSWSDLGHSRAVLCQNFSGDGKGRQYRFTCIVEDKANSADRLFLVFSDAASGSVTVMGGLGRYEGSTGEGRWRIVGGAIAVGENSVHRFEYELSVKLP